MTKELELKLELEPIAKQTINDLFVDKNLVHIATVENTEQYVVIDCHQEYFDWWVENKAEEDDFYNSYEYDHEDGGSSRSKSLNPDIDIWNIKDFSEFVRATSEKYWLTYEDRYLYLSDKDKDKIILPMPSNALILEIELNDLITKLDTFKIMDKTRLPSDLMKKVNDVKLRCRNIGLLS